MPTRRSSGSTASDSLAATVPRALCCGRTLGVRVSSGSHGGTGAVEVRVIVVHGIGSQKPGSTASRWADAIVRFTRAAGYQPVVREATLTGDPARVTVRLPRRDDDAATTPTYDLVLEEAHWADSFAEPSLGRVVRFLLTIAPVLAITQSLTIWRTRAHVWPSGSRSTRATHATVHVAAMVAPLALGVVALGLAAPVIAVLLLLLLVASALPIAPVRQAVGKALGWLSTSIGDAYLFVADPVNRAAMEKCLADRLTESSSHPTVVLAHSQGAALAYRALRRLPADQRPTSLITVGSGVGRLHQVGLLQTIPWYLTPVFVAVVASAATGIALADRWWTGGLLLVAALLTLLAWRICASWLDEARPEELQWSRRRRWTATGRQEMEQLRSNELLAPLAQMSWLDIWASFDPVPTGRASQDTGSIRTGRYQLARVAGEQSLVRDHVRYDRDWDQTMPLVLARLLGHARTEPIDYAGVRPRDGGPEQLERIPLTSRDWWGLALRLLPLAAVGVALVLVDLFSLGQWLRTAPPGFLDGTVDAAFVPLRTAADFLDAVHWPLEARPQELLGVLALVGVGLAGSVLTRRVLGFLQRRETTAWLATAGPGRWSVWAWRAAFVPVALASVAIPAGLVVAHEHLHWTPQQTVEAYLTAVAEDDVAAICELTADDVIDGCGADGTGDLRTCGDAREAVAALDEDAITVDGRAVEISWDPETPPACDNAGHALVVPTRVGTTGEPWRRWQVTAVGAPAG